MDIRMPQFKGKREVLIKLDKFNGGTYTLIDDARLALSMAKESVNLIQVQDGLWKTKWGSGFYGAEITGETTIDGATEYITSAGVREIIAVGGTTGKIFKSTDDAKTWNQLTEVTLTAGKQPYFLQINNVLFIANGTDNLTVYNGTILTQYTSLAAPTNLALERGAGLTSGNFNYYYEVTALNAVGETIGSTETSIAVNKDRDVWSGATECINLTWNAVSGALRYQIYFSDETGKEVLLGSSQVLAYSDTGLQPNPYITVPLDNTTSAPKFHQMVLSGNRIWATKDSNNPWRVYFSGTGVNIGYFSDFYGGGWVDLEKGGRDRPVAAVHYRTGKGDPAVTVFCASPEGKGSVWQIGIENLTVGTETFTVPVPSKVLSTIGANSPLSVVTDGDNVYCANNRAVFALRNKPQLYNILATDELSVPIRPSYQALNATYLDTVVAHPYRGKVFFSIPRSTANDSMMVYDTERRNWSFYWSGGGKQFFESTDSGGTSHLLTVPVSGNTLVEISENISNDLGVPFNTSYISPLIPVGKDKAEFAKITEVVLELGRPKGTIETEVLGLSRSQSVVQAASKTITDTISQIDFANALWGEYMFGDDDDVPVSYSQATTKKTIKVNKILNSIQFHVYSTVANTDYTILSIQAKGHIVSSKAPSSWN